MGTFHESDGIWNCNLYLTYEPAESHYHILHWVHANIAGLGGDPSKVLLFGQSAGADDTFTVSALPQIKSLVSVVALESGGGQDATPFATAQLIDTSYAQALECTSSDVTSVQVG